MNTLKAIDMLCFSDNLIRGLDLTCGEVSEHSIFWHGLSGRCLCWVRCSRGQLAVLYLCRGYLGVKKLDPQQLKGAQGAAVAGIC